MILVDIWPISWRNFVRGEAAMQTVERAFEIFDQAADVDTINDRLARELKRMGFKNVAYRAVNLGGMAAEPYFSSTYPAAWLEHYQQNRYFAIDPVFIGVEDRVVPIRWGFDQEIMPRTKIGRQIIQEAREFGICSGITVPVHGAGHEFAAFTVTSDAGGEEFSKLLAEQQLLVHLLAPYYHNAIRQRLAQDNTQSTPRLTPRERECLLWTAKGKTAWEVGQILAISDGTVVFHLKNATRKFNVFTKYHAVVKAIMLGLISP